MSSLKVYACVDWDAVTETCNAHAYIDPPTILPTLTAEEGAEIGWAMVLGYVTIKVIALLRIAATDRVDIG